MEVVKLPWCSWCFTVPKARRQTFLLGFQAWLQADSQASGFRSEGGRSSLYGAEDADQEEKMKNMRHLL